MNQNQGDLQSRAAVQEAGARPTTAPTEASGVTAVGIAMYCVLLVAYALMAADRYLFPVLAADVRREFGFSLANTGLLTTIFTLGLGIGGLPTGFLLARFSRKTVLLIGIAVFSAATAATTIAVGFWSILLCLLMTGIGMAMLATSMFALAASYFSKYRAAAIGSVNVCYGLGAMAGPILTGILRKNYQTWHAPMVVFGAAGFVIGAVIVVTVRPWLSDTRHVAGARSGGGGARSLLNRNTILLTALSILEGLAMYGFLGMFPTFLRESQHYSAERAGLVMSFFGLGALISIAGGWLGDRFSPRLVLSSAYLFTGLMGLLFFSASGGPAMKMFLTGAFGAIGSGIIYVNLAGYHVKALDRSLANRGSGMFVTTFYGSAAFAGYLFGALAGRLGWATASNIQCFLFSMVAAVLALALRPKEMAL